MSSITPFIFDGAVLTGSATAQGSDVPALTKRIIKAAALVNTTGAPIAATVYLVPDGVAAGAANMLISARAIPAGESYPCYELLNQGLNAGGEVHAMGDGLSFKYTAVDIT